MHIAAQVDKVLDRRAVSAPSGGVEKSRSTEGDVRNGAAALGDAELQALQIAFPSCMKSGRHTLRIPSLFFGTGSDATLNVTKHLHSQRHSAAASSHDYPQHGHSMAAASSTVEL